MDEEQAHVRKGRQTQDHISAVRKIILVIYLIAAASAQGHGKNHKGHGDDSGGHDDVRYVFEYGVHEPHTKDIKSHYEERNGKHVVGHYTLLEPDGTKRIVKYKAGPHTGFEATVERIGHGEHMAHYGGHGGDGDHSDYNHGSQNHDDYTSPNNNGNHADHAEDDGDTGSSYVRSVHWRNRDRGGYKHGH